MCVRGGGGGGIIPASTNFDYAATLDGAASRNGKRSARIYSRSQQTLLDERAR